MKRFSGFLAILLSLIIIFCVIPTASAEEGEGCRHSFFVNYSNNTKICELCKTVEPAYGIQIGSATVSGKTQIKLNVNLTANSGITFANYTIDYDETKLELVEIEDCGILGTDYHDITNNGLGWSNETPITATGVIAVLTFNVKTDELFAATVGLSGTTKRVTTDIPIAIGNGTVCVVGDTVQVKDNHSVSAELTETLKVHFHLDTSSILTADEINDGAYAVLIYPHSVKNDAVAIKQYILASEDTHMDEKGRYVISCNIIPTKLHDTIDIAIYTADAKLVFERMHYTAADYLEAVAATEGTKAADVASALLDYGRLAQVSLNYNALEIDASSIISSLPDAETVKAVIADKTYDVVSGNTIALYSTNLIVSTGTTIRHTFILKPDSIYEIGDYTATVKFANSEVTTAEFIKDENGDYYIDVPNITSTNLDTKYTVTVTNNKTNITQLTLTTTALEFAKTYITDNEGTDFSNMLIALYKYNVAADAYFETI